MCVVEKPRGGILFSATDSCSVVLTTLIPGAALEAAPTDQPTDHRTLVPATATMLNLPSHLEHLCWDVTVNHKNALLLLMELFVFESWAVWDCMEHMS